MHRRTYNILVGLNHTVAFDRRAFMGASTLANERSDIRLVELLSPAPWAKVIQSQAIDGLIISRPYGPDQVELESTGIPVISIADREHVAKNEYIVAMDEPAIGLIAARYFLEAGYEHFAVCTRPGLLTGFSERIGGFVREVEAGRPGCAIGPPTPSAKEGDEFEDETSWAADAASWIASLPKPLAVFSPYDYHAHVVVNVARQAGLRVPDDVAVIGVDDDDLYCMTTSPQLSSVVTPGRQIGQLALAKLLDVLQGKSDVPRRTLIKPPTIMLRGSSSDFALQDADVIEAVRFIRENASRGVSVGQVADHILMSRRTLERRFMLTLKQTVRDAIRRAKVDRARRLLIDTDLSYAEVARRSGLVQRQQLNRAIKAATGRTPAQIRTVARQYRPL